MNLTIDKFRELFKIGIETDYSDFKRELHLNTRKQKYNLVKDFLAFANYGGGYMLIGIDDKTNELKSVKTRLDPALIGDIIEGALGFNIKFEIRYFKVLEEKKLVGLIYIFPSQKILTCPKNLNCENNKLIISQNDILYRRNTKSIKANSEDIENMNRRISKISSDKISDKKYPVFNDDTKMIDSLWNAIKGQNFINAESFSSNIRGLLLFSEHSKSDFAKMTGFTNERFEQLLLGQEIPELSELIRICNFTNLKPKFFFESRHNGRIPFWNLSLIRYAINKRVKNPNKLEDVMNVDGFYGEIIYQLAKNIVALNRWIDNSILYERFISSKGSRTLKSTLENRSDEVNVELKGELSLQYYKVLEQFKDLEESQPYTEQELMIVRWMSCSQTYVARIITESISQISIDKEMKPVIQFHFWNELKSGDIRRREYDGINFKIIFS